MELSQESIHDVIHPTAAFSDILSNRDAESVMQDGQSVDWQNSVLNPKNRIDSLSQLERPLWRIDGCTAFGSQFYAVPLFVDSMPPLRVDVFIPEPSKLSLELRQALDVDVAFHTTSARRIAHLGITQHVLRILQYWTLSQQDPVGIFRMIPYGSRIVLKNMPKNVADAEIIVAPTHYLERQLWSVSSLQAAWGADVELPPVVDLDDVVYVSQLHDSVCLVEIDGKTWIFKALTSYTKYLYHELKQLLTIPHTPMLFLGQCT